MDVQLLHRHPAPLKQGCTCVQCKEKPKAAAEKASNATNNEIPWKDAAKARWRNDHPLASAQEDPGPERAEWAAAKKRLPKLAGGKEAAQKALIEAVKADDPDAVARAVASDADVEAKVYYANGPMGGDCTAVFVAAYKNKLRALRFLLCAAGADPNADCGSSRDRSSSGRYTPCYVACREHHHAAVRMLVARGARPDHSKGYWDGSHKCTCPADIPRR